MGIDLKNEPHIVINGVQLTEVQAMTMRVGVGLFLMDCPNMGNIGKMYGEQLTVIAQLMRKKD